VTGTDSNFWDSEFYWHAVGVLEWEWDSERFLLATRQPTTEYPCDSNERVVWCYLCLKLRALKFGMTEYASI
jgi:hypothetical protein